MAQLMPLPLTVSCFSEIQIGFTFWYWLTWVVPEIGPLSGCVCIADRDIINTSLEPLRPADVPFGGYKTETKDLGGIFFRKIDFWL